MNGNGEFRFCDGRRYVGQVVKAQLHGSGRYTWPDGRWYEGQYENGLKHGQGRFVSTNPPRTYVGGWSEGQMHGRGQLNDRDVEYDRGKKVVDPNRGAKSQSFDAPKEADDAIPEPAMQSIDAPERQE